VGMMERKMKEDGRSPCGVRAARGGGQRGGPAAETPVLRVE